MLVVNYRFIFVFLFALLSVVGCSGEPEENASGCAPDAEMVCDCRGAPGPGTGLATCKADETWSECVCPDYSDTSGNGEEDASSGSDTQGNSEDDTSSVQDTSNTPDTTSAPDTTVNSPDTSMPDVAQVEDSGGAEDTTPDLPDEEDTSTPVNPCQALEGNPNHELCEATATTCAGNYLDGSSCRAFCETVGMECVRSFEGDPVCEKHDDRPELSCDVDTGHESDWCECGMPEVCEPSCDGRSCGDDGCGGSCGGCGCGQSCDDGECTAAPEGEPTFARTREVTRTIIIDEPGVYDYEGVLHVWAGGGTCNQNENQPYILRIAASNVTLRNFAYRNAPDGIHIGTSSDGQGHSDGRSISNIVLENVTGWACEDAMTTQFGVQDLTIRNSTFYPNPNSNFRDKLLQMNFGDITIENSTFHGGDAGVCVMFKGSQDVHIRDSCFLDCDRGVNGSTQNGIVGRIGSDRSTLLSENNEARFPDRAPIFWDPWKFLTADGDVHVTSSNDTIFDNGFNEVDEGATIQYR